MNADGQHGVWRYAVARKVDDVRVFLGEMARRRVVSEP